MTPFFERFPGEDIRRQEHLRHSYSVALGFSLSAQQITEDEYRDARNFMTEEYIQLVKDSRHLEKRGPKKPWVEPKKWQIKGMRCGPFRDESLPEPVIRKKPWFGPILSDIERHREGK